MNCPLQAAAADEREMWVRRLEDTILRHASRLRGWDVGSIYNNFSSTKRGNIIELFDRKVTEADAYLQLLIEQVNVSALHHFTAAGACIADFQSHSR